MPPAPPVIMATLPLRESISWMLFICCIFSGLYAIVISLSCFLRLPPLDLVGNMFSHFHEVLAGDIAKTDEFLVGLECLIATMEAAALDQNFGKYNLPLYHNEAKRLLGSLRLSTFGLSTENYDSPYVLSTEGFKETAGKVWQAFKDMLKRFYEWLGKRFGKGSKSEQIIEKTEQLKEKAEVLSQKPEVAERIKKREHIDVHFTTHSLLSGRVKDKVSVEEFAKAAFDLFREVDQNFEKLKAFLKDLDKAKTEDEVNGVVAGHGLSKLLVSQEQKNQNILITMPVCIIFRSRRLWYRQNVLRHSRGISS